MEFCVSNEVVTPDSTQLIVRTDQRPIEIAGPYSKLGKTLPNYTAFHQFGENSYQATVSDPAVWTPDHPVFYRMKFSESTAQAIVGIRKHEVCGKSIYVDGRRYVMRAVSDGERPVTLEFAESRLSILLPRFEIEPQALASGLPADSLAAKSDANALGAGVDTVLEMATYRGIPVLLEARSEHELQTIACFTSWPCVFAVILPVSLENGLVSAELSLSKNALRLSRMGPDDGLPAWAHGAVMSFDALASNDADRNYPVFAERRSSGLMAVAAIRRACEQLQCDLAPQYDLAGYIVS